MIEDILAPKMAQNINVSAADFVADDNNPIVGLYVGGIGNVACTNYEGDTVTFNAVPVGTYIRGIFKSVLTATTTATLIVAYQNATNQ